MAKFSLNKKIKKLAKKLTFLLPFAVNTAKVFVAINLIITFYNLVFIGRIFPNVYIAGVDVSGLTPAEANSELQKKLILPKTVTLLSDDGSTYNLDLTAFDIKYDLEKSAYVAYNTFRTGNLLYDLGSRTDSLWKQRDLGIRLDYDQQKFDEALSVIAGQIFIEPVNPKVSLTDSEVVVEVGRLGRDVNIEKLKTDIGYHLSQATNEPTRIETKQTGEVLTLSEKETLRVRAEKLIGKKLILTFEFQTFILADSDLVGLLAKNGYSDESLQKLIEGYSPKIERTPQNPSFVFEEGRVKEFAPSKPGVSVDQDKFKTEVAERLRILETAVDLENTLPIAVKLTQPDVSTDEVNNLGINELIGRGSSTFRGSIATRIFNVNLAATRLNGVLIKPGEEFSFNGALGDVSKLTGYKEAYVIKDGKTVLGDGGGVCQVSTTLFRAAMNAGLPIVERRAHAYRVGYYEQDSGPGLDATVYSPTTDMKFKNDTPGHILIQAYPDTKKLTLVFELYGTSDGRKSTITKPVTGSITPPPEDLYVDDPTLPAGTIKQIEHKAWGAKSTFNYTVERDGEIIYSKVFVSNYRPWGAVYLRGTGPVQ